MTVNTENRNNRKLSPAQELTDIVAQLEPEEQDKLLNSGYNMWRFVKALPVATRRRVACATPYTTAKYAIEIRKRQWGFSKVKGENDQANNKPADAEKVALICTDAEAAWLYADYFNVRLQDAEHLIVACPMVAVEYASKFNPEGHEYRGYSRWQAAEPAILQDGAACWDYYWNCLEGSPEPFRWIEGEPAMVAHLLTTRSHEIYRALAYARNHFARGWPAIDPLIASLDNYILEYINNCLRGRFLKYEQALLLSTDSRRKSVWKEYVALMKCWGLSDGLPVIDWPSE